MSATALATSIAWGSSAPTMTFSASYEAQRSGANMQYKVNVDFDALTNAYGRYFGYPIYLDVKLDGTTVVSAQQLKAASPSNWSAGQVYYHSGWLTVSNKTSGTTALQLKIYSGMGSSRSQTYEYNLPVSPAASTISTVPLPFIPGSTVTIGVTRQNSNFTHTLKYKCGTASGTIVTKVTTTSISWASPIKLYNQLADANATSVPVVFTLITYDGNTKIGEDTATSAASDPAGYKYPAVKMSATRGTGTGNNFVVDPAGTTVRLKIRPVLGGTSNSSTISAKIDNGTAQTGQHISSDVVAFFYFQNITTSASHTATATITDTVGNERTYTLRIEAQSVPANFYPQLPGVAFGKVAEIAKAVELASDWSLAKAGVDVDLCIGRGYDSTTGFFWRKWSSGLCELWGSVTDSPSSSTALSGTGSTYYSDVLSHTLPFSIYEAVITGTTNHSGYLTATSWSGATVSYRIARGTDIDTSQDYTTRLHIIGRWTTFSAS